jgi:endonuclease YncB( thermonuclease family)
MSRARFTRQYGRCVEVLSWSTRGSVALALVREVWIVAVGVAHLAASLEQMCSAKNSNLTP